MEQAHRRQATGMQLQQLQHYMQAVEEQLQETSRTLESLEELEQLDKETDAYVPLTSGIYVKARIEAPKKLLINVGNRTISSQSPAQAKKLLKAQQAELEHTQEGLTEQFTQLYEEYVKMHVSEDT
jgi:prefoldin alpha subunit